ncbi:hypothetical protein [Ilumatobacter nonamiensis]|uniref:hypothetical protein n=1 Tax=Ilumatobacter nonamiensis TaxID=467093 RepID=UPI00034B2F29|nr:hypothetical protein [Ilumatobacter nonamiensis]
MTDDYDMENETTRLASQYVDGEVTADERALVETSTDALDEVDEFTAVRTVLEATAPIASLSEREGHLAAALDVWERMSEGERAGEMTPSDGIAAAAAAAVSTPSGGTRTPRSGPRRQLAGLNGRQWFLGAAAALTMVAGLGFVVRGLVTNDDADTSEVAVDSESDDLPAELGELEAAEAAEVNGENVGADVPPVQSDLSDEAATSGLFPADEAAAEADATGQTLPGEEQPAPPPDEGMIAIENSEDLADYASFAIRGLEAGDTANDDIDFEPAFGSCESELGVEEELEPVIYAGTPVVVGVDLDNDLVLAYTPEECDIIARTSLPNDADQTAP